MALFGGKNEERNGRVVEETREVVTASSIEAKTNAEPNDLQAHLGRGSRIQGTLSFQGSVRIDGQVEGQIEAKDTVIIGDSAQVVAQITAGSIVIKGNVTGDLTASKRVELRSPGRLLGNIVTPSLIIQDGVVFEGHCSMAAADTRTSERVERERDKDKKVAIFPTEERAANGPNGRAEAAK